MSKEVPLLPTLKDIATRLAIRHIRHLSDVGHLPSNEVLAILEHSTSHTELARIENATMQASHRDITHITWAVWQRFFQRRWPSAMNLYSAPGNRLHIPNLPPSDESVDPSPGFWPSSGIRQVMLRLKGDWKALFMARYQEEQEKLAKSSAKLRAGYSEDKMKAEARKIEVIVAKAKPSAGRKASQRGPAPRHGILRKELGIVKKPSGRR
jgi:hypothetical protein